MPKKKMDSKNMTDKNMKKWLGLMLCVGISVNVQAQSTMGRDSGLSGSTGILREKIVKPSSKQTSTQGTEQAKYYCLQSLDSDRCRLLDMSSFGSVSQRMIDKKVKVMGYIKEEYDVDPKTTEKLNSKFIMVVVSMKTEEK